MTRHCIIIGQNVALPEGAHTQFVLGAAGMPLLIGTFRVEGTNLWVTDMGSDSTMEDLARVFEVMAREVREKLVGTEFDKAKEARKHS